jgi:hypothetical protein
MARIPRNSKRSLARSTNKLRKDKARNRYRRPDRYIVYIGDRETVVGKSPILGHIDKSVIDFLGIKAGILLKFPNGGVYRSVAGLEIDFNVIDGVLWKATTGTAGGVTYNSNSPVPVTIHKNKLKIRVLDPKAASGTKTLSIGIPPDAAYADALNFVKNVLNIDKIPKVLSWTYGKVTESIRTFDGDKKKEKGESAGDYYIPVGIDADVKRNQGGGLSNASNGALGKKLIVATLKQKSAILLGFEQPQEAKADAATLAKGTFSSLPPIETKGGAATGKRYKIFAKLALYSLILDEQNGSVVPLSPGSGLSVKARYSVLSSAKTKDATTGRNRKSGKARKSSKYASMSLPSGIPVAVVFDMLVNVPNRPTSFQVSTDGKTYGNSYPLPSKRARGGATA